MRKVLGVILFVSIASLAAVPAPDDVSARIARVENGLLPAVLIENGPRWSLAERMAYHRVPGVSVAVIKDFKIDWAKAYGVLDSETRAPATVHSLFQAASISKPVSAAAALVLVQNGTLSLDAEVNAALESWKLPDNELTAQVKVTLKHLLSHTGGTTVSGFPGYVAGLPAPSLLQVLNGEPPANTAPIRVDLLPGKQWRYSGGGYTVVQQMLIDAAGKPFPEFLKAAVLDPLGMADSTFDQPLPPARLAAAAAGHRGNGKPIDGKRNTYPELAAAGLWTTSSDLARFAIEIQLAAAGRSDKLLSQAMVERMLTPVLGNYGLGFGFNARREYFQHTGGNAGFTCILWAHRKAGTGVAIMTNSENGPALFQEILRSIAKEYQWEGILPAEQKPAALNAGQEDALTGRYVYQGDEAARIVRENGRLVFDGFQDRNNPLIPLSPTAFYAPESGVRLAFTLNDSGKAVSFNVIGAGAAQKWERAADAGKTPFENLTERRVTEALAGYRRIKAASPEAAAVAERRLNTLGYRWLAQDRFDLALAVLALAEEFYPRSANACDSLAEAYAWSGNRTKALEYYRKVLDRVSGDPAPDKAGLERLKANAMAQIARLSGAK